MVDARYRNKKNGKVAVITQEDPKFKTAMLEYEEDGREQQVSFSTLKRWWEELDEDDEVLDDEEEEYEDDGEYEEEYAEDDDEEYEDEEDDLDVEEEEAAEIDLTDDAEEDDEDAAEIDLAGDGTPLKEVGKQIAAQAKQKAAEARKSATKKPAAKKEKKETKPQFDSADLQAFIVEVAKKSGCEVSQRMKNNGTEEMPFKCFKLNGHNIIDLHYSRSRIYLDTREGDLQKHTPDQSVKSFFTARFIFTADTAEARKVIKDIFTDVVSARKAVKPDKAESKKKVEKPAKENVSTKAKASAKASTKKKGGK